MNIIMTCKIKPYIQPFERRLALAELIALTGGRPKLLDSSNGAFEYVTVSGVTGRFLASRLAYWEHVSTPNTERHFTTQVLREATFRATRNDDGDRFLPAPGKLDDQYPLPNRRCLRYGPHGVHEYRGKYFPQLVRALINIAGASTNSIVADPMSGSGTTSVEAVLSGCRTLGADMNPLSVFMAATKCAVLALDAKQLARQVEKTTARLARRNRRSSADTLSYFYALPEQDRIYLAGWFSPRVLRGLDTIAVEIESVSHPAIRGLFLLALSNIIRGVSWQKKDDLRVRKEIRDDADIDPVGEFLKELRRSAVALFAFLGRVQRHELGPYDIRLGDARRIGESWRRHLGKVDVVITSPPYATALPYLDTDRLSLAYLGLLPRSRHRQHDLRMIGNREVGEKIRQEYWDFFLARKDQLPGPVANLVLRVHRLNQGRCVGFRRRNLPALLAKYFFDMRQVLGEVRSLLRPGASAYVVVGNNHTIAGGQRVEIQTAKLLADLADSVGLVPKESISMEMLISRDVFRKNAVRSEAILALRKPA